MSGIWYIDSASRRNLRFYTPSLHQDTTTRLAYEVKVLQTKFGYPTMLCCWGALISASLVSLWRYETEAGKTQDMIPQWPDSSGIARDAAEPKLLMFVHPRCPCSEASVVELENVLRTTEASATVVVWLPAAGSAEWLETSLIRRAAAIDGVAIHYDHAGNEAKRFGIMTSGHCLVFDKSGSRIFSGGITGSRGHVGRNTGSEMMKKQLESAICGQAHPVYGCPLEK